MLEKEAWSNKADNVFCSENSESIDKASSLASDVIRTPVDSVMDTLRCELSGNESIQSEKTFSISDCVGYQHRFPEADNTLSFFDKSDGKDSNDLLGYCWDDLGNFEDVDRMFRSCDSTLWLGNNQEDDLGWLSFGESKAVLKSDFNHSCPDSSSRKSMSESEDTSRSNGMTCSINDSEVQTSSAIFKGSGQLGILSFNGTNYFGGTDNKDKVIPKGEASAVSLIGEPMKFPNQPKNHKNDQYVGNGAFFYATDCPEAGLPIEPLDSHSFEYLHSDNTFIRSDYCFPSDQNSLHPAQSAIKSENSHPTCVSTKNSYSLNQMQVMDSEESSLHVISFEAGEKGEWINWPNKIQSSSSVIPENNDFGAQTSMSATISSEMHIHYSGNSYSDGVNNGIHPELGSSVAHDSSRSSAVDDISIEATSFHQLQLVMEQLDLRTKLCIRGSLYRLAQSAEQRHQYVKLNGGPIVNRDSLLSEGSTKFPVFVDMETDTNPIDRSIAHLLFHGPADLQALAGRDAISFSSPGMEG